MTAPCIAPIRMIDPHGVARSVRCKSRRHARCPSCSTQYGGDAFQLIKAGMSGGKDVPETVATRPRLFVTLTAPSFGAVHRATTKSPCRPRRGDPLCEHGIPLACMSRHAQGDRAVGTPMCPDCYDYEGAVLFNFHAPELWRRFTIALKRRMAAAVGLTPAGLLEQVRVQFAKVAEFQARGVVHFHAIIRLDGADDSDILPHWATEELLAEAIKQAVVVVSLIAQDHLLQWGDRVDARPIVSHANGELSDNRMAGYLAKYTTKAAEDSGGLDRRVRTLNDPMLKTVSPHVKAMVQMCFALATPYRRLDKWAHMLGFGGHYTTKSRRYSTTFQKLRTARAAFHTVEGEETVPVIGTWRFASSAPTLDQMTSSIALRAILRA